MWRHAERTKNVTLIALGRYHGDVGDDDDGDADGGGDGADLRAVVLLHTLPLHDDDDDDNNVGDIQ